MHSAHLSNISYLLSVQPGYIHCGLGGSQSFRWHREEEYPPLYAFSWVRMCSPFHRDTYMKEAMVKLIHYVYSRLRLMIMLPQFHRLLHISWMEATAERISMKKKKRRGGRALNEKWTNSCTQLPQPPRYCSCHCLLKSDHKPEILRIQYARYVKGKKSMCRTLLWVAEMLSFVSWWPGNSGSLRTDGSKHSIPGSVDTNPILTYISYSSYTHIHNLIPALSFEHLNLFLARRSLNW